MRTQRVVYWLTSLLGMPAMFISVPLGCAFGLLAILPPFVVVIFLLSLIHLVFIWAPLVALSWLWLRVPILRPLLAIIGVPWAVIGYTVDFLIPELDEDQSPKITKLLLTESWPYSWTYLQWDLRRPVSAQRREELLKILERDTRHVAAWRQYVITREQQPT